ncbi:MAG: quinolinate synthase NadA [Leptospirales bacterium]|nr:quinolinate synthase NadA [Leptospirales bacterium]
MAAAQLEAIRASLEKTTMLPHEIDQAMPLIDEILALKKQKNAVILGHNYMTPDVYHGVSDFVGDSLGLARLAAASDADIILFNGVHFMAETAKIVNPQKLVLIADLKAGCSLAESITAADVRALRQQYPGAPVVTYVNCSAAVKAETDICCTSANALRVVESLQEDTIIFLPDEFLARNVQQKTAKRIISWERGKCMVHELYRGDDIDAARRQFDDLLVIAHPECDVDVTGRADYAGSTSQMADYIASTDRKNIMLVTECSMGDNLRAQFPERHFVSTCHTCPHMKKITLRGVRDALLYNQYAVDVPEEIRRRARRAVDRMLEIA